MRRLALAESITLADHALRQEQMTCQTPKFSTLAATASWRRPDEDLHCADGR
jgi:hypothetical protein